MEDLKKIQEFFSKPLEENVDKKYSDFLIALRDSGITNMFGAAPYLQAEFGLDKREAREVLANWMRSFGESLNENAFVEAFKLEKALKDMGYDVKVKYLDDFGKDIYEIYFNNPADADESIFYDAKKLGYDNVRVFANPQESVNEGAEEIMDAFNDVMDLVKKHSRNLSDDDSYAFGLKLKAWFNKNILSEEKKLTYNDFVRMVRDDMMVGSAPDERPSKELVGKRAKAYYNDYLQGASVDDLFEATKEEENEFHKKLDKLVHKTFGHSSDEKKEMEEYNSGIYYNPAKDNMRPKAKEASKSGLEKVKDMLKKIMKEDMSLDDQAKAYFLAKVKKGEIDTLPDNPKAAFLAQMMKNQMGEALSDYEEEEANYDELYSDYKYKVTEAKPKKGHGEKISKEVFAKLKGKTINYKGQDYKVVDSDEAVLTLKDEDGKSKTINLRQFNVSGMIDEIMETIELGKNLNEELCPKGKAYIKKRKAAGEKSSAYLSGRAVKVCKGQMKG